MSIIVNKLRASYERFAVFDIQLCYLVLVLYQGTKYSIDIILVIIFFVIANINTEVNYS